ncbi:hypothetical protein [Limnohabitans sp. 103DPR2]|uniref:hypothetical protein n=1 Tax=Limnohabitans sp. 103DPR2 TaxID=1678129 RepID=UPI0006DC0F9A|nr:hypothetical protein [Limnohabitans sp. 103DPR2]ALK91329.1 hypothetical protein L103DPR2_00925 [Limnohabitans sp. 103DPR2]
MTINELKGIKPIGPMTPEKARIEALKRTKDAAAKNLKAERERQKLAKARDTISTLAFKSL